MARIGYSTDKQGHEVFVEYPRTWHTFTPKRVNRRDEFLLGFEYEIDLQETLDDLTDNEPFPVDKIYKHYYWTVESTGVDDYDCWEIKSHIAPLWHHKLTVKNFLKFTQFNVEDNGDENTGGIHVSITATDQVKDLTEKLNSLISPNNEQFLLRLSQRDEDQFQLWCSPQISPYDKYSTLNTGKCRGECYEFRLFAAKPELLIPAMEALDSMYTMARDTEVEITPRSWADYCSTKLKYRNISKLLDDTLQIRRTST